MTVPALATAAPVGIGVARHNARISSVPTTLLVAMFGWRPRAFFTADPGHRDLPDVTLPGREGPALR